MKLMPIICLTCLSLLGSVSAQENVSRHLLLREEWFTLPQEELRVLLVAGFSDPELRLALLKRVREGTASMDRFMLIRTKSGMRTKVEQINEFPYPTDFDPWQVPRTLTMLDAAAVGAAMNQLLIPPVVSPVPRGPLRPGHSLNGGLGLQATMTSTTFAVRSLGDTLEIDPVISESGTTIDITFASERANFVGNLDYNGTTQPQFQTSRITANIQATTGLPVLAGTCSKAAGTGRVQAKDDDRVTVSFLTAIVTAREPTQPTPPATTAPTRQITTAQADPFSSSGPLGLPPDEKLPDPTATSMRLQLELISLPTAAAAALIDQHLDDATTHQRLLAMLPTQAAQLEKLLTVRMANFQRALLQQISETAYATDFDPPQLPQTLTIADPRLSEIMRHGGSGSTEAAHRPPMAAPNAGFGWITGLSPTTYTIRNVGETVELSPVLGDDGTTVNLTISAETLRLVGEITFAEAIQPVFETQKLLTSITTGIGQPCLLGTMSKPIHTGAPGGNETDRVWLAFITVLLD